VIRAIALSAVCASLVVGVAVGGPKTQTGASSSAARVLDLELDGDDADFVLRDPAGRLGIMAIDSAGCWIPDCTEDKFSDMPAEDHDDSDTMSSSSNTGLTLAPRSQRHAKMKWARLSFIPGSGRLKYSR